MRKSGEVARHAGVVLDTVRYYERVGILPHAVRRASGYRQFDQAAVDRIRLVKQLQDLSLTLDELSAMLVAVTEDAATCARESTRIQAALRRTEERIEALTEIRDRLRGALARCDAGQCDIVERGRELASATRTERARR